MNDHPLVTTTWLAQHWQAPDLRCVDASWYLPASGRNAREEYANAHIPGAVFFDIDEICDTQSPLPHMLPDTAKFASRAKKLGLGDGHRIIVYDGAGIFAAARVWWMFRAMGHRDVAVLDGGFPKWTAENHPVTDDISVPKERHFTPRPNNMILHDRDQVLKAIQASSEQIVDARPQGRFLGLEPEPRPGLRLGHMPGAKNYPYTQVLNPDGTMKSPEALRLGFRAHGIDPSGPIIATCGSGVSAAVLLLALAVIGAKDAALYDGSWAEWGADPNLPIER